MHKKEKKYTKDDFSLVSRGSRNLPMSVRNHQGFPLAWLQIGICIRLRAQVAMLILTCGQEENKPLSCGFDCEERLVSLWSRSGSTQWGKSMTAEYYFGVTNDHVLSARPRLHWRPSNLASNGVYNDHKSFVATGGHSAGLVEPLSRGQMKTLFES
ncbi:hypothetical protein RRG08_013063 [Elysia crispata]|uniref:Uncharacterized protein n=1 Tax=Elysia crispata TaxID=231223 RepID=A0AAE1A0E2_9GAST|nr:hypothetical protein RRG08_013063 [Elysia crispata]